MISNSIHIAGSVICAPVTPLRIDTWSGVRKCGIATGKNSSLGVEPFYFRRIFYTTVNIRKVYNNGHKRKTSSYENKNNL